MNPPPPSPLLSTPQPFTFGSNHNVPFLLPPTPVPRTQPPSWAPPPLFSPEKAFPLQTDVKDIDMADLSPFRNGESALEQSKPERDADTGRPMATGGLRRIYNQRRKRQENRPVATRNRKAEGEDDIASDYESEEEGTVTPLTQNTSNHYTLNMPAPAPLQSDLPYILLGYFFPFTIKTKMR